ncbi:MAG: GntR family transcriptional regulator [Gemmatimonadales bacterium]
MFTPPNPSSGVPVYLQLIEQVKHAVATGILMPGDQLPGMRRVAEDLVINPNTVAKAYRELEHEGWIELRHGAGAFVTDGPLHSERVELLAQASEQVRALVEQLRAAGVTDAELRRILESELNRQSTQHPVVRP